MRTPIVRDHRFREVVLAALKTAQTLEESSPQAMARATRAIVETNPDVGLFEAFNIVWNIWET